MENRKLFASEEIPVIIYRLPIKYPEIGQCEACPPGIMSILPDYNGKPASEYLATRFESIHLYNDFEAVFAPDLSVNPVVLNRNSLSLLQKFQMPASLNYSDNTLKKFIELNLLHPSNATEVQFIEDNDTLTASLHLADSCNLSCDYCYLPNRKIRMSEKTGLKIIDKVIDSAVRNHYKKIKIKYTGGEPLMDFHLVSRLHRHAEESASRNRIELSASVLSNGTLLTPKIVEQIKKLNLHLMISLDGIGKYHDCQRHFPNGSGSFEKVSDAITMALSKGLVPDISVTVSSRSIEGLPELMQWILNRELPFSINFYRENSQSRKYKDLRLEEEKIIRGMLAAYRIIESCLPRHSLLASLADRANIGIPHLRTCSAGHSYLVFDCKGNISKCQMDIPVTDIDDPDPVKTIRAGKTGLQNPGVDDKEECSLCQWKYWCGGGCPLEIFRCTGRYDRKSPNCNIYRSLFPEIIRLEGLRLLKYTENS